VGRAGSLRQLPAALLLGAGLLPHTLALVLAAERWLWHLVVDSLVIEKGIRLDLLAQAQEQVAPW